MLWGGESHDRMLIVQTEREEGEKKLVCHFVRNNDVRVLTQPAVNKQCHLAFSTSSRRRVSSATSLPYTPNHPHLPGFFRYGWKTGGLSRERVLHLKPRRRYTNASKKNSVTWEDSAATASSGALTGCVSVHGADGLSGDFRNAETDNESIWIPSSLPLWLSQEGGFVTHHGFNYFAVGLKGQ